MRDNMGASMRCNERRKLDALDAVRLQARTVCCACYVEIGMEAMGWIWVCSGRGRMGIIKGLHFIFAWGMGHWSCIYIVIVLYLSFFVVSL